MSVNLVPLEYLLTPERKSRLFDKVVECVREFRALSLPTVVSWQGETVDGYFSAAMIGGTVSLNWAEREYQIRYALTEVCYVGGTLTSVDLINNPLSDDKFIKAVSDIANIKQMSVDTQNVKFEDVMKLMNWRYKNRRIKVETSAF
jgi:hypothetical protein